LKVSFMETNVKPKIHAKAALSPNGRIVIPAPSGRSWVFRRATRS